ncbi:MAG: cation diffusion facilitator family transporter [Candidatus Dormibacteria bacterium]
MSKTNRLIIVLALNLALVAALVAVGISSHSLGVLAEGGDYVLDAAAVGVALLAMKLAQRPAGDARSTGLAKGPNVAALVNAGWLLMLEILVAVAAAYRLATGVPEVHGLPVLVVSGVAAIVMTGGATVLGRDDDDHDEDNDLTMRAVLLDTIADAAAAASVAIVGGVIFLTHGWYWLDPAVAVVITVVVGYHAVRLSWQVVRRLRA